MKDKLGNYHITKKGYPRFHSGIHRNKLVHRVYKAIYLGRELKKDEDVHHANDNKLDWSKTNLRLMGHAEHGCVSAKQHWALKKKYNNEKEEWDAFWAAEADEVSFNYGANAK